MEHFDENLISLIVDHLKVDDILNFDLAARYNRNLQGAIRHGTNSLAISPWNSFCKDDYSCSNDNKCCSCDCSDEIRSSMNALMNPDAFWLQERLHLLTNIQIIYPLQCLEDARNFLLILNQVVGTLGSAEHSNLQAFTITTLVDKRFPNVSEEDQLEDIDELIRQLNDIICGGKLSKLEYLDLGIDIISLSPNRSQTYLLPCSLFESVRSNCPNLKELRGMSPLLYQDLRIFASYPVEDFEWPSLNRFDCQALCNEIIRSYDYVLTFSMAADLFANSILQFDDDESYYTAVKLAQSVLCGILTRKAFPSMNSLEIATKTSFEIYWFFQCVFQLYVSNENLFNFVGWNGCLSSVVVDFDELNAVQIVELSEEWRALYKDYRKAILDNYNSNFNIRNRIIERRLNPGNTSILANDFNICLFPCVTSLRFNNLLPYQLFANMIIGENIESKRDYLVDHDSAVPMIDASLPPQHSLFDIEFCPGDDDVAFTRYLEGQVESNRHIYSRFAVCYRRYRKFDSYCTFDDSVTRSVIHRDLSLPHICTPCYLRGIATSNYIDCTYSPVSILLMNLINRVVFPNLKCFGLRDDMWLYMLSFGNCDLSESSLASSHNALLSAITVSMPFLEKVQMFLRPCEYEGVLCSSYRHGTDCDAMQSNHNSTTCTHEAQRFDLLMQYMSNNLNPRSGGSVRPVVLEIISECHAMFSWLSAVVNQRPELMSKVQITFVERCRR